MQLSASENFATDNFGSIIGAFAEHYNDESYMQSKQDQPGVTYMTVNGIKVAMEEMEGVEDPERQFLQLNDLNINGVVLPLAEMEGDDDENSIVYDRNLLQTDS